MKSGLSWNSWNILRAAVLVWPLATVAHATTLNVPAQYATIQAALNAAATAGDEIVVVPGTYHEAISLLGKAVYLHSSAGAASTIIDATGLNLSVVTCTTNEGPGTVLSGFTITGGNGGSSGGGMLNVGTSPTVLNCAFIGNSADQGGGMANINNANPSVLNCTFRGNTGFSWGGGIWNQNASSPTVVSCIFSDNAGSPSGHGGGMANYFSGPTVTNCTFSRNSPVGIWGNANNSNVTNCILWGDSSGEGIEVGTITYSDVQGGYGDPNQTHNLSLDPLFVDPNNGNFRLPAASACVDTGDPNFVATPGATDVDGHKRVWDGHANGTPIVDMGAYEFGSHRYGDLNCDGVINFDDINAFVLALSDAAGYHAAYPSCDYLLADINGDGSVTFDDINPFVAVLSGE